MEEAAEFRAGEVALDDGELLDGFAEVDEQEVALVAELREEGGLVGSAFGGLGFERREQGGDFSDGAVAGGGIETAPCGPVEAKHLMQEAGAIERERKWRCFGQESSPGWFRLQVAGTAAASGSG